jgi:hypothetical protein
LRDDGGVIRHASLSGCAGLKDVQDQNKDFMSHWRKLS